MKPPARLRAISDSWARRLRWLWILLFGLAALTVVVSTIYAVKASYWTVPVIQQHGLDPVVTTDGNLRLGTLSNSRTPRPVPADGKVVAFDGKPVPDDFVINDLAELLSASAGPAGTITVLRPGGQTVMLPFKRATPEPVFSRDREVRVWTRLGTALLACTALLVCSFLLALRRPNDPVAMILALAFAGLAASIDPPLQMWLWTNQDFMVDILGGVFFYLLAVGLAAFPDGVFIPRFSRWLIPVGIPLAVLLSIPNIDEDAQGIIGITILLSVLVSQFIRFRRESPGIVRQQIKWAGFGFTSGLLLVFTAVVLAATQGDDPSAYSPVISLLILVLFSLGMAAIPLGLLVALTRFRLWEADTVITRSAAYAVVTLIVGVVWAASSDLVKLVITEVIGHESEAGATTAGAIVAAGIFSPTQSAVLGWTRRHFGGPLDRIRGAAERLKSWGLTETPAELAKRALGVIDEAVHPLRAAIAVSGSAGTSLLAANGVASAADTRLLERLELADEEGPVGTLHLGRRSDGNRYNRQELEAVRELLPHIADALRVALERHSRESLMQQQIEAMAARLAQLEGGAPNPA